MALPPSKLFQNAFAVSLEFRRSKIEGRLRWLSKRFLVLKLHLDRLCVEVLLVQAVKLLARLKALSALFFLARQELLHFKTLPTIQLDLFAEKSSG